MPLPNAPKSQPSHTAQPASPLTPRRHGAPPCRRVRVQALRVPDSALASSAPESRLGCPARHPDGCTGMAMCCSGCSGTARCTARETPRPCPGKRPPRRAHKSTSRRVRSCCGPRRPWDSMASIASLLRFLCSFIASYPVLRPRRRCPVPSLPRPPPTVSPRPSARRRRDRYPAARPRYMSAAAVPTAAHVLAPYLDSGHSCATILAAPPAPSRAPPSPAEGKKKKNYHPASSTNLASIHHPLAVGPSVRCPPSAVGRPPANLAATPLPFLLERRQLSPRSPATPNDNNPDPA